MPSRNGTPAKLSVVWSQSAQSAFDESLAHIASQDLNVSHLVRRRVFAALDVIALQPNLGTRTRRGGVKRFPIPGTGHVIEYQASEKTLTVVRWIRQARVRGI